MENDHATPRTPAREATRPPGSPRRSRRRIFRTLTLCAAALASLSPSATSAQGPGDTYVLAPTSSRYGAAIDEARRILRAYMEESWAPGLSVAVAVEGETVWSEGMGYADLENRVPVTTLSKFRSGSIAKSITGTSLVRLWERGEIDLDAPVRRYVPEWPEKHPTITVRQLAHHISGIRHYDPLGTEFFNRMRYTEIVDALELFADDSLLFSPGERYSYSTWGYNLLGAAIRRAAGMPFPAYVDESVFEPLGMRSTVADHSDTLIAHRVSFYERSGEGQSYHTRQSGWESGRPTLLNGPFADNSNKWPGGGFLTNPEDLVRLGSALLDPGFLTAEGLELLFTPGRTNDGESVGYGLGWRIGEDDRGLRTIGHGGGAVGGTSDIVLYPDRGVVVALQVNKTDAGLGDLTNRIAWLFMEASSASEGSGGGSGAAPAMTTTTAFPPRVSRSSRGAVVTQAPLATEVGVRVLSEAGNAVDAAVATAFALAVVEPTNSGLGGRTQMLIRRPDGTFAAIDGTTQVPSLYPADTVVGPD
ncbi:MAG: serine hydrolase, partial [Gemmatimonadetes bacterium]|nr:serine hydrolase [Gemmatimonadota bacterium]NIR80845.1 serine hydrolase [Gemmatimonadota bacterium]NIT89664.1 serine hydrolase [Gemmatimonadota bacterium]NIU33444.1 serine hydrolase [Gemmatimonadota bacterium]NIU37732.1 serine hydrolase [Gemmatimonadota bacterium]